MVFQKSHMVQGWGLQGPLWETLWGFRGPGLGVIIMGCTCALGATCLCREWPSWCRNPDSNTSYPCGACASPSPSPGEDGNGEVEQLSEDDEEYGGVSVVCRLVGWRGGVPSVCDVRREWQVLMCPTAGGLRRNKPLPARTLSLVPFPPLPFRSCCALLHG